MRLNKWEDIETSLGGFPVCVEDRLGIGFLTVYETREQAEKEYPGGPIVEIREVSREPGV